MDVAVIEWNIGGVPKSVKPKELKGAFSQPQASSGRFLSMSPLFSLNNRFRNSQHSGFPELD